LTNKANSTLLASQSRRLVRHDNFVEDKWQSYLSTFPSRVGRGIVDDKRR